MNTTPVLIIKNKSIYVSGPKYKQDLTNFSLSNDIVPKYPSIHLEFKIAITLLFQ